MLNTEERKSILEDISSKKRGLLVARIKQSSGDNSGVKNIKNIKKEVARLFTKLNAK